MPIPSVTGAPPQLTFDRAGASRWTAYNWETNASNGGSDYFYENDDNLSSSTVPAEAVRSFIAGDQSNGMATLMTVPLQGLVAADENGPVSLVNPPDMSRFKRLVDQKSTVSSAPFTMNPPTSDADVFADEFVWALDQKFPAWASSVPIRRSPRSCAWIMSPSCGTRFIWKYRDRIRLRRTLSSPRPSP